MMKKVILLFLVFKALLQAETPWLTGSLLAPQATTIKKGAFFIDPYIYFVKTDGTYSSNWKRIDQPPLYTYNFQPIFYYGIQSFLDIEFSTQIITNQSKGKSSTFFGDTYIALEYQLYRNDKSQIPAMKLNIGETFPTGKYQNLNPKNFKTDATGNGSYATTFGLVLYKVYHIKNHNFLSANFALDYTISAPVTVKGVNVYGGDLPSKGKVKPGNALALDLSFEWTFNKHWEVTLDNVFIHTNSSHFSKNKEKPAQPAPPSSELISFALGLGYNFSENLALLGGYWFSAMGKNANSFKSCALEFLWTL